MYYPKLNFQVNPLIFSLRVSIIYLHSFVLGNKKKDFIFLLFCYCLLATFVPEDDYVKALLAKPYLMTFTGHNY